MKITLKYLFALLAFAPFPLNAVPPVKSKQQAPGYYRATLGSFDVVALCDGVASRHLDQILSKPDVVASEFAADHEKEPVDLSINAYLINTGEHLVLVDTGAVATWCGGRHWASGYCGLL